MGEIGDNGEVVTHHKRQFGAASDRRLHPPTAEELAEQRARPDSRKKARRRAPVAKPEAKPKPQQLAPVATPPSLAASAEITSTESRLHTKDDDKDD